MKMMRKTIEKKNNKQTNKNACGVVYLDDDKNGCPEQKARDKEEKSRRSPRNRRHFFFVCVRVMICVSNL